MVVSAVRLGTEPIIITEVTRGGRSCVLGGASRVLGGASRVLGGASRVLGGASRVLHSY